MRKILQILNKNKVVIYYKMNKKSTFETSNYKFKFKKYVIRITKIALCIRCT